MSLYPNRLFILSSYLAVGVGSNCSPGGDKAEAAGSNSSQAGRTSPLCHSADPLGASEREQRGGSRGKEPDWGWPLACLIRINTETKRNWAESAETLSYPFKHTVN